MKNLSLLLALFPLIGIAQTETSQKSTVESKYLFDSIYAYKFISPSDSFPESKSFFRYDSIGNLTLYVIYDYEQDAGQMIGGLKNEYTYNTNGQTSQIIEYIWGKTKWLNYIKIEYTYNSNKKEISEISYIWDNHDNQFLYDRKKETTYDVYGRKILSIDYIGDTNQWYNNEKNEYTYGDSIIKTLMFNWNSTTRNWDSIYKNESAYDVNRNLISKTGYLRDTISNQWYKSEKYEYSYDAYGKELFSIWYNWNKSAEQWIYSSMHETIYDANGNGIVLIIKDWDTSANQWNLNYKYYSYYSLHDITRISILPNPGMIKLYPNPVKDFLNLEINSMPIGTCKLYNSTGQLNKVIIVNQGLNSLNIGDLRPGLYFIQIQTRQGIVTQKILKE